MWAWDAQRSEVRQGPRVVFHDAVVVPGGEAAVTALEDDGDAVHFMQEAYKHCEAVSGAFVVAIAEHRHWSRSVGSIPA